MSKKRLKNAFLAEGCREMILNHWFRWYLLLLSLESREEQPEWFQRANDLLLQDLTSDNEDEHVELSREIGLVDARVYY